MVLRLLMKARTYIAVTERKKSSLQFNNLQNWSPSVQGDRIRAIFTKFDRMSLNTSSPVPNFATI